MGGCKGFTLTLALSLRERGFASLGSWLRGDGEWGWVVARWCMKAQVVWGVDSCFRRNDEWGLVGDWSGGAEGHPREC